MAQTSDLIHTFLHFAPFSVPKAIKFNNCVISFVVVFFFSHQTGWTALVASLLNQVSAHRQKGT